MAGQGEHLHPGEQFAGQGGDLAPDLVLGVAVEEQTRSRPVTRSVRVSSTPPAWETIPDPWPDTVSLG